MNFTFTGAVASTSSLASLVANLAQLQHSSVIRLDLGKSAAVLDQDIVIRTNTVVLIDGGGGSIKTGGHQIVVVDGARLCLYNLHLMDGTVCIVSASCM